MLDRDRWMLNFYKEHEFIKLIPNANLLSVHLLENVVNDV